MSLFNNITSFLKSLENERELLTNSLIKTPAKDYAEYRCIVGQLVILEKVITRLHNLLESQD